MEKKGTPRKSLVTLRIPCSRTKVKKGWNLNMYLNGKQVWNFVGSFCGLHFLASKFPWLKKPTNTLPSGKCFFGIPGIIFTMSSWWWPGKPRERGTNDRINSLTEIHLYKLLVLTCRIFCKITSPVGDKINFTLEKWMAWNPWDFLEDPPSPFEVFSAILPLKMDPGLKTPVVFWIKVITSQTSRGTFVSIELLCIVRSHMSQSLNSGSNSSHL